jgi:hypothetical protein
MAFRVREGKVVPPSLRSDHLANRYVLTGPMSHGPGGGWRMPPVHRAAGPQSHHSSFAHPFDGHREPPEDKSSSNGKYLFRSSQPHLHLQPQAHLWANQQQQQPGSLRGHPMQQQQQQQPGSLRGQPPMLPLPPPPAQTQMNGGGLKKQPGGMSSSQPLRRAVSFLDRPDLVQLQQPKGSSKQPKSLKFQEEDEVTYDPWSVENGVTAKKDGGASVKKMGRSKSFMDPSQSSTSAAVTSGGGGGGEGKVRKMLRKSASILYPSWLAAARRNSQSHQPPEGEQQQQLKKESPPHASSSKRPAKEESPRHQPLAEVEDLDVVHQETGQQQQPEDTPVADDLTATTGDDDDDDDDGGGWESMEKNDRLPATTTTGKSVVVAVAGADESPADVMTGGPTPRRPVQLPRLGERNRIIVQSSSSTSSSTSQSSPTVGDHPNNNAAGSVLSSTSSSSTSSSTLPKNKKPTGKWHISSGGPKSLVQITAVQVKQAPTTVTTAATTTTFKSAERRWQSLIVLPDLTTDSPAETHRHGGYPSVSGSIYRESTLEQQQQHKKRNKSTSGLMAAGQGAGGYQSGSTSFLEMDRDYATVSWEDLSDSHMYHHLHPIKGSQSHTSLALGHQQQQQRLTSCPSYESLDDYLITSDDESRRHYNNKTSHSLSQSQSQLVYCDSFESLPRPPPPADADYSPPDISPDDSSETHRGDRENNNNNNNRRVGAGKNRVRVKLQRLPTFIQRQEAWQRKPWNQKAQQQQQQLQLKVFSSSGMIPEDESPEQKQGGGPNWRRSHALSVDQEEEEVDEEEEEEEDDEDDLSRGPGLIHHRAAAGVSARGGGGIKRSIPAAGNNSNNNNPNPVYWHDWLPPPAALLDCGCGLCRITASMNGSGTYQLRAPMPSSLFAAPQPPSRPPPPHVFPPLQLHRQKQQQQLQQQQQQQQQQLHHKYQLQHQAFQKQLRQLPGIFGHIGSSNHHKSHQNNNSSVRRDASFNQQPTAKPPPPRKVFYYYFSFFLFPL